jgi:tetratricopeptide (TPR) repeat protein
LEKALQLLYDVEQVKEVNAEVQGLMKQVDNMKQEISNTDRKSKANTFSAQNMTGQHSLKNYQQFSLREGQILENYQKNGLMNEESFNIQDNIFAKARKLKQQGKIEEAVAIYHQAIARNPNLSWTYYLLGETLEEADCLHKALDAYSQAAKLNPNSYRFLTKFDSLSKKIKK